MSKCEFTNNKIVIKIFTRKMLPLFLILVLAFLVVSSVNDIAYRWDTCRLFDGDPEVETWFNPDIALDFARLETITSTNVQRLTRLATFTGINQDRISVDFSSDGQYVAASGSFTSQFSTPRTCYNVWAWDMNMQHPPTILHLPEYYIRGVVIEFIPNTHLLLYMGGRHNLTHRIWNVNDNTLLPFSIEHNVDGNPIDYLDFSPTGELIAYSDERGYLRFWEIAEAKNIDPFNGQEFLVTEVKFSPTGDLLAFADPDNVIHLWNIQQNLPIVQFRRHQRLVRQLAFNSDGSLIASADWSDDLLNGAIYVWDVQKQETIAEFDDPLLGDLTFNLEGTKLYFATQYSQIFVWDMTTQASSLHIDLPRSFNYRPVFSNVENLFIGASEEEFAVFNLETGEHITEFGWTGSTTSRAIKVSPDGRLLAIIDSEGTLLEKIGTLELWGVPQEP